MKDKLSAFLDGDLDEPSARAALDALCRDPALRRDWDTYCLIGDVLRQERQVAPDFTARVMAGIYASEVSGPTPSTAFSRTRHKAANQRRFWQLAMPLAASVMGVAAVALVVQTMYLQPSLPVSVATTTAPAVPSAQIASPVLQVAESGATMPAVDRDALNRQFIFVHQSTTGGGPMGGAVQYARTVSDVRGDAR